MEKGGNASYQHFFLYPQCLQKQSCPRSLKWGGGGVLKSLKKCFSNIVGKEENAGTQIFSPFTAMFYILSGLNPILVTELSYSSADAFNVDQSLTVKAITEKDRVCKSFQQLFLLTLSQTTNFRLFQIKSLQMTISNFIKKMAESSSYR